MQKRDVIKMVLDGEKPPYVPWHFGFTKEAQEKLNEHFGGDEAVDRALDNHFLPLGEDIGFFDKIGENLYRDHFGVVWDRTIDKDIGCVQGKVLQEPTLEGFEFPNPYDDRLFEDIPRKLEARGDRFRVFQIGFSLYERAWSLRGMESLLMDFYDNPDFVRELFNRIADYNIAQARKAMTYNIDAVYFGDDWGQQLGLQMGPELWNEFIRPVLNRMYGAVKDAGKYVTIHCCGKVEQLFDDLVELGVDCFNPFQPEVMDVFSLLDSYRGRLAFHGGLSTQRTLPYGTVEDVRNESRSLIEAGREGGYIFAPAHDVEGDVPLENMLAFIEEAKDQPGYPA